jgi:hypothetical protein
MDIEQIRDIAVIVLAVLNVIWLLALLIIAVMFYKKLVPMLNSIQTAVQNIQATTTFVAETTVSPIIRALSVVAGVKAAASTVMGKGKGGK